MDTSSKNDLLKQIKRYQSCILSIDPPENDEHGVLRYMRKLSKLPIKFDELEETGIGKTINALRKRNGIIGEEATLLVAKWKSIVKKQMGENDEEEVDEKKDDRKKSKRELQPIHSTTSKSCASNEDAATKSDRYKLENSSKSEKKSDAPGATHLITLKNRNKRKHSEQMDDGQEKKYIKISEKEIREPCSNQVKTKKNDVEISPDKIDDESSHSEEIDSDSGKSKKKDEDEDKKTKKLHEKRHKSGKHRKTDRHHKRSKSSHHEKKREEENIESSHKHRSKESKSRNKDESKRYEKKHVSDKQKSSTKESKTNGQETKRKEAIESYPDASDDFGAALLNIPNTVSVNKKRSSSSKSSVYQDSLHSPSPQKSQNNIDSNKIKLEPLDLNDDLKDTDDLYSPPNNSAQRRTNAQLSKIEEDNMLNSMIVTKNQRTKVWSGNKVSKFNNTTKFPTLFELCARVLQQNFDALEYTGGVPYDVLKSILDKVTAQQLYIFENYNPYLIGSTDELWEFHAKKEFRNAQRMEYETWRDLYVRCIEEREEKLASLTNNIAQSMANSTPVRKAKLAFTDAIVKPPRNVARSQAKYGTGHVNSKTSPDKSSPTALQSVKERLAKEAMSPTAIHIPSKTNSIVKKKKAPLMQKTLQLFKGLNKR